MLSRRSIFSLFAAVAVAGAAQAAQVNEGRMVPLSSMSTTNQFQAIGQMFPRGMIVTGGGVPDRISDGAGGLFLLDSPEGRDVLQSMAAPNAGMSRW